MSSQERVLLVVSLTVLASVSPLAAAGGLAVYGPVPGLAPSPYYSLQVRQEGSDSWLDTFSLLTECTTEKFCNTTGYYDHLGHWSNSYVNFQMEQELRVEVKITKLYGEPVVKAVVRPEKAAVSCEIREGEAGLLDVEDSSEKFV